MKKPTMLYASPFPPVRSGISEYSVHLVHELAKDFEITLYTDDYDVTEPSLASFRQIRRGKETVDPESYDYRIYNIGNQPRYHGFIYETALRYPGAVLLHDFSLYYLFTGYYLQKEQFFGAVYRHEGIGTLREIIRYKRDNDIQDILHCDALAAKYSMNRELLRSRNRFIVHSEYAREQIMRSSGMEEDRILRIGMIQQVEKDCRRIPKEELYRKYHIPQNAVILAAFGLIANTKMNRETAETVLEMNAGRMDPPLCYLMVGEGAAADDLVDQKTVFKTGYVPLDEMNSFMEYANLVVNLRNPTRGETSASMIRALELGKPCITNNGGWFTEIPEDCVLKIDLSDAKRNLKRAVQQLLTDPESCAEMGERAKAYIRTECDPQTIREKIVSFLQDQNRSESGDP